MEDYYTQPEKHLWWIASYPKSGSTWVRLFLNCYVTGFPAAINSPWQYCVGDHNRTIWRSAMVHDLAAMSPDEMPYYRAAAIQNAIHLSRSPDVTLKTHHALATVNGIPLIPPELTKAAVYIVRDPRRIAPSLADHMGIDLDAAVSMLASNGASIYDQGAPGLQHVLLSWSSHVDSWTIHNETIPTTVIRWEDLVVEPETTFRKVLAGLGFPDPDPDRLNFAIRQTAFDRLQSLERDTGFAEASRKAERFFARGPNPGRTEGYPLQVDEEEFGSTALLDDYEYTDPGPRLLSTSQRRRVYQTHRHTMERHQYTDEEH